MENELRRLVRDRIDNFLGYGDPESDVWVMGMEEGGCSRDEEKNYVEYFKNVRCKNFAELIENREFKIISSM